eukprot:3149667-Alexandrium_andersonii.AAC.1
MQLAAGAGSNVGTDPRGRLAFSRSVAPADCRPRWTSSDHKSQAASTEARQRRAQSAGEGAASCQKA